METTGQSERYHVVCRRCTAERVFDTVDAANDYADRHAGETAHPIVVERVD
ncbi:hypothetical protein J2751_000122 [Halorubrum alkaliphilum]|uniref:Uncharacterized protein n=1 Tax=Halorubrum alkaliphilum TaxID=261290 RepID=A0A8T4GBM9_9EURY|nr:hypothetical protein [Halorubrum alkaliphilum]MBP1921139.1 hypothetical protein [Halorubrum alkaliphilum]